MGGEKKNQKFEKKLKMVSFASWNAILCVTNILSAIFSTILFTHASVLKNTDEMKKCVPNINEIIGAYCTNTLDPDMICEFDKIDSITKWMLYGYSAISGILSVFWLIRSCCMRDKYFPNHQGYNLARENRLALHMISHLIGFIFATSCMITVSIHWYQTSDLNIHIHNEYQSSRKIAKNCDLIFPTMNAIGITTLTLCALTHAFLVTYIFLNNYQKRFSSYYVSYKGWTGPTPNINLPPGEEESQNGRPRISSNRNYPSSPIMLSTMPLNHSLNPLPEELSIFSTPPEK